MFEWLKRKKKAPEPPRGMEEPTVPVQRSVHVDVPVPPVDVPGDVTLVAPSYAVQARQAAAQKPEPLPRPEANNQVNKTSEDARDYMEKVRAKENALSMRFAAGYINRKQFEELYASYQQEIRMIEQFVNGNPDSQDWRNQVSDGQSILIRRKHAAQMIGFSIYDLRTGLPLKTKGDFGVDPDLFVPMLYAYQSATREIFGGEVRLTQIQGGKWLCFIPGKQTSTIALFNNEPTQQQLKNLEQSHKVFEDANANQLRREVIDPEALVLPHDFYLRNTN